MESEKSGSFYAAGISSDEAASERMTEPRRFLSDGARSDALISTLEGEIVPRLLMLCRSAAPGKSRSCEGSDAMDAVDVEEVARLLLAHGPKMANEFVEAVRQRGVAYERICVDLLVPAAHRLAERWKRRDLSYPQLKVGLDALQSAVVGIHNSTESNRRSPAPTH